MYLQTKRGNWGIIDQLVDERDLRSAAINYAKGIAAKRPLPLVRDRTELLADAKRSDMFNAMRKSIVRKARNQKAPYHAIAAVEAAVSESFEDGLKAERALFAELENSDEAKALRYAFFAEREVAKIPGASAGPQASQGFIGSHCRGGHDGRGHRNVHRRAWHSRQNARSLERSAGERLSARA